MRQAIEILKVKMPNGKFLTIHEHLRLTELPKYSTSKFRGYEPEWNPLMAQEKLPHVFHCLSFLFQYYDMGHEENSILIICLS